MAPRFKRKRQTSHSSSNTHTSHGRATQSNRFRPSSLSSGSSPQRRQPNSTPSQANPRHQPSQDSATSQARAHDAADSEEPDGDIEQVVMAIDRQQKGAVGCAYYVACEEKLYCLHDLTTGNLDAIEACKSFPVAYNSINMSQ
jgi:DNA mismatch repair protein MSH5